MHARGSLNKKELTWKSEKQEKKTKKNRADSHNWSDFGLTEANQETPAPLSLPPHKAVAQYI